MSAHGGRGMGGGGGGGAGSGWAGSIARGGQQWDGERATQGQRGRNLRGLLRLLGPYRLRVARCCVALAARHGRLAGAAAAGEARDRRRHRPPRHRTALVLVVIAFLLSALLVWAMTYVQTYLVGWVGQRALADLRIRIFTHLQSQPIGFYESRPAGVLISRMTNDVEALESLVTDSVVTLFQSGLTLVGAVVVLLLPRPQAGAVDILRCPVRRRRLDLVPARLRRRVPAHARDDRLDHRLPAGDALRHPRRAQLRPGAPPRGALRGAQRGQPRREHGHGAPERRVLPGGRNALRRRARADRPLRRLSGDRRPHHRRHGRRLRRARCRSCSNRSSSSPSSTPPTSPGWPRSRRSSSCWTSNRT